MKHSAVLLTAAALSITVPRDASTQPTTNIYLSHNLVSDLRGFAERFDPNLVNSKDELRLLDGRRKNSPGHVLGDIRSIGHGKPHLDVGAVRENHVTLIDRHQSSFAEQSFSLHDSPPAPF